MATTLLTLTKRSTKKHLLASEMSSSAAISLRARPRRRCIGEQVTAVTWPCQLSWWPEEEGKK